jgi:hypothetical protein
MSGQAVELPLRQLLEVRQLEEPQRLKSQRPRRKRKKKVEYFAPICSNSAHTRPEKEESDEDMGFGLFD